MSDEVLVKVENVSKKFCRDLKKSLWYGVQDIAGELFGGNSAKPDLRTDEFWALKNVSFELRQGESLGLIGPNGAGKSTLLKVLNGLMKPDQGRITMSGRVGALIELGTGFNPILTGRENIYVNGAVLGISKQQVDRIINKMIDFAGIDKFIDTPVQSYSSGMRVRLGFAIAAHLNPDVLLVDEVLAVGDTAFQRKCLQHMMQYLQAGGSLVLVSHNMHLIQSVCDRCLLLNEGQVKFEGAATEGVSLYFQSQHYFGDNLTGEHHAELSDDNPVVIETVDISPVSGDEIRSGESVRLSLHYHSIKDIAAVTWGFSIWTGDQWVRITTCTAKYSANVHNLVEGKGQLCCIIPSLPLVAGTYAIKAGIYDLATSWPLARIGWEDAAVQIIVKTLGSEVDNRHAADGDLVAMDVEWSG